MLDLVSQSHNRLYYGAIIGTFIIGSLLGTTSRAQSPGFGLNVKTFGAVGDCKHDDTEAIQTAVNQINGRTLYLPAGCYAISQPIKVPLASGFRIVGEGREGTNLQQQTDNTPILVFTQELTHSFGISDLMFSWARNQSNQNTNSVGILFSTTTSGRGGVFEFSVSHVTFANGFRGMYLAPGNHGSVPVWGFALDDIIGQKLMSGSTINLTPYPGVGMPRCMLHNIYSNQSIAEPQIKLSHCTSGTLDNIEDNNGVDTSLDLVSNDALSVRSVHIEYHRMTKTGFPVIAAENSKIDFEAVSATVFSEVPGKFYLFSNMAGGGSLSLKNVRFNGISTANSPQGIHNSPNAEAFLLHLNGAMRLVDVQGLDLNNSKINSSDDSPTSQKVSGLGRPAQ